MKKKFNWLGFAALVIWDISIFYYISFAMRFSSALLSMSSETKGFQSFFNIYYIIIFVLAILIDLVICKHNIWMIILGLGDLIWYGVEWQFQVPIFSIVSCVLLIAAGIYGLVTANKTKNSESSSKTESDK